MNEPKSSRYHRLRRRAGLLSGACTVAVLVGAARVRLDLPPWGYALVLAAAVELVTLPIAFYRGAVLERRFGISTERRRHWLKDQAKAFALAAILAAAAAEGTYALIRWNATWWWLLASAGGAAIVLLLARVAPVLLLPLFYRVAPLDNPRLVERLRALSSRAGVRVLGIYEWALGSKTRRANAVLTGTGAARRILLSDTLLAEYSEDEIEVILAHELAHHVHRDITKGLLLEIGLIFCAALAGHLALQRFSVPAGLNGMSDPAGLPVLVLAAGAVMLAARPLVNYLSRMHERRADRFALDLTGRAEAFVSAMRRLGAQNLSEERPSKLAVLLFHTHPTVEERIDAAREQLGP